MRSLHRRKQSFLYRHPLRNQVWLNKLETSQQKAKHIMTEQNAMNQLDYSIVGPKAFIAGSVMFLKCLGTSCSLRAMNWNMSVRVLGSEKSSLLATKKSSAASSWKSGLAPETSAASAAGFKLRTTRQNSLRFITNFASVLTSEIVTFASFFMS